MLVERSFFSALLFAGLFEINYYNFLILFNYNFLHIFFSIFNFLATSSLPKRKLVVTTWLQLPQSSALFFLQ